jgi:glycosyltransferase involved in cell wall biosynthesis
MQQRSLHNPAASSIVATPPLSRPQVVADAAPPLRIALLGYRSAPFGGGQGIYLKYLSKALVDAGHQVDVISGEPYPHLDPRVRLIKLPGLNLYEYGLKSLRPRHLTSWANIVEWFSKLTGGFAEPYAFGRRAVAYLKKHRADYDIVHDNQSLCYGLLAIERFLPLVTTLHHPITRDCGLALDAEPRWYIRLMIRRWHSFLHMQKKVVQRLQHIVTVSQRSSDDSADAFDVPASKFTLIYNGINTDEFTPQPQIARKPFRLIATASADAPLKGLRFLLLAVAQLLPQYPLLELLVIGKPRPGGPADLLLDELGIRARVLFASGITTERLVEYYAESAIAVVPSLYEGFGLPAGEAMACGLPVVSTTGGALPEVVGDAGMQVPPGDAKALAQAIAMLLDDAALRDRLSVAARARIEALFCWNVNARKLVDYYREVIAQHVNR